MPAVRSASECLEDAIENGYAFGIFGGLSANKRRAAASTGKGFAEDAGDMILAAVYALEVGWTVEQMANTCSERP